MFTYTNIKQNSIPDLSLRESRLLSNSYEREMEGKRWADLNGAAAVYYQRCFICPKCTDLRICRKLLSTTARNFNRHFFTCPTHNFIKWADKVQFHELIKVPYCGGCSAGACRVRRETAGPHSGRVMFMCRIKEGEGSCGYRVWQDELDMSKAEEMRDPFHSGIGECNMTSITVTDRNEESDEPCDDLFWNEVIRIMDHEVISHEMDQLKCVQEKSIITSRKPHKLSFCGDIVASDIPKISASPSTAHVAQNISTWMTDALCQNLNAELNGWWGRLLFHPMISTSLVSYPVLSTFLVQENSGLISIIPARNSKGVESYRKLSSDFHQKMLVNSGDTMTSKRSIRRAESHPKSLVNDSARLSGITLSPVCQNHGTMSESISNAFHEAAKCLRNELLNSLETMDVKDHEAMKQAAEDTWAALDCLHSDHRDFKKRVEELIRCASQLFEINQAMPTNDSHYKLAEFCSSEREALDKISRLQTETAETVIRYKKRIKVMKEAISSTPDRNSQIEALVCDFEAVMRNLELQLEGESRNKEVLERKYVIATKELEESEKLLEHKQVARKAARVAFDMARALLRE